MNAVWGFLVGLDEAQAPELGPANRHDTSFYWVLMLLLLIAGCSNGQSSVSGTLTLDGSPLGKSEDTLVTIMFLPESGSGATSAALADEAGQYELATGAKSGLAPGKYVVTLVATQAKMPPGGGAPTKRIISPMRYSNPKESGLVAEVKPGSNTFDFDLKSDPK